MSSPPPIETSILSGFLLSRHWRDTDAGVELSYWASTDSGPLQILITGQEALCFCEREKELPTAVESGIRRVPLALRSLQGQTIDGLYSKSQRSLTEFSNTNNDLFESDIRLVNRYLMERFVSASFRLSGELEQKNGYLLSRNPKLANTNYQPVLTAASLDIETDGFGDTLYSIAVAHTKESVVFMQGDNNQGAHSTDNTDSQHEKYSVRYFSNERTLLRAFFLWWRKLDPDLIIGWNVVGFDLYFLQNKCRQLNIPYALGRADKIAYVMPRDKTDRGIQAPARARIPGRATLDGIDLLRAGFWSFESFSLENVASKMLGKGKIIKQSGAEKVHEINRQFREDKEQLAAYNIEDCFLVQEIFEHADLFNFAIQRAQMTGLDIDRMGGSVATFDNVYLPRLHRQGFVAPDIKPDRGTGLGSPGGYVLDSQPGLYRDVLVLDFKSLYPSIIRTFLIDPLGLHIADLSKHSLEKDDGKSVDRTTTENVQGFLGAEFSRENSILPDLVGELWNQRDKAKASNNAALSQAIKIIMNSFYGVLGTPACRFYDPKLASSITLRGHEIITKSLQLIEQQGFKVIYGDTDSLFVLLPENSSEKQANDAGTTLAASLNTYWRETLKSTQKLQSYLEVEFETHFLKFLMPTIRGESTGSKKRYAGLIRNADNSVEIQFKGLEAARTDWTPLAREFQRELYWLVFHDEDHKTLVNSAAEQLLAGELDDKLVYRKRLRRKLEDYTKNVPPHVQAARKLDKPGSYIEYVITLNGPEPVEQQRSAIDYQHYLDRQLAPAADGILHFLGDSFAELTSTQLDMF
ncbi:MAG: DNA polymerase II [Pseudomonadales bacterium]